jgi:RNA polymerase sigma-70 factor (ECF subfamily)
MCLIELDAFLGKRRPMDTSASLLERVRQRSDEADWRRLVELYTPLLRTWVGRHVPQPDDVNDIVQQVFTVLVARLPEFVHSGRPGAFRHWLRRITANHLRNFWRSRRPVAAQAEVDAVLAQLEDPASDPSRHWDQEHDAHVAARLLEYVEPEFRPATWQAFRRLVLDGAAPQAVAAELGLSVNAVLIAKSRVLRRLHEEARGLLE